VTWCQDHDLAPLTARRGHVELYVRWMQEVRRLKSSTVSRRVSIVAGFYRTCVVDGLLEHSPAEHVRRPRVSNESPTLGLLGLRIFEATGPNIEDLGEEHGHRVLLVRGKGDRARPGPPSTGGGACPRTCRWNAWLGASAAQPTRTPHGPA
jgi:integrase/recombinase XerD